MAVILIMCDDDPLTPQLCIWEYPSRKLQHKWSSGHTDNIFCAKFMPASCDRVAISCARDAEVRVHTRYGLVFSVLAYFVHCSH